MRPKYLNILLFCIAVFASASLFVGAREYDNRYDEDLETYAGNEQHEFDLDSVGIGATETFTYPGRTWNDNAVEWQFTITQDAADTTTVRLQTSNWRSAARWSTRQTFTCIGSKDTVLTNQYNALRQRLTLTTGLDTAIVYVAAKATLKK